MGSCRRVAITAMVRLVATAMAATGFFIATTGIAGASLPAYTLATVVSSGLIGPNGLAFDSASNLFVTNDNGVSVLPKASGTIFGHSVSADTLATVVSSGLGAPTGLAFDSAGDLFVTNANNTVSVLPKASGTLFGHSVTADTLATVVSSGLDHPFALAFDSAGDLFIASYVSDTVSVLPKASGKIFGHSVSADTLATVVYPGLGVPAGLAFDSAGDLFIASYVNDTVSVLPKASGTLFGHSVSADTLATVVSPRLDSPCSLTFDSAGDLFIANYGNKTVSVVPKASGTIFGHSVSADTLATVVSSGLDAPIGLAFDSAGDLLIANYGNNTVSVLPKASGTIFGHSVTADTLATVVSPRLDNPYGLTFDSAGDLFIANDANSTVSVLPKASGTLFGHSVTADTLATVVSSGLGYPCSIALDSAGDLFIANYVNDTVSVLPKASGKIFGHSVTADTLATVVSSGLDHPFALAFDSAGDLFIASYVNDTVSVLPKASGKIFGHSVTADTLATVVSSGLSGPVTLAFDSAGDLFVANANSTVSVLPKASGKISRPLGHC